MRQGSSDFCLWCGTTNLTGPSGRPRIYCCEAHRVAAAEVERGYRKRGRTYRPPVTAQQAKTLMKRRIEMAEKKARTDALRQLLPRIEYEWTDGRRFAVGETDLLIWLVAKGWKLIPPDAA